MYEISVIMYLLDNIKTQAELAKLNVVVSSSHAQSVSSTLYIAYLNVQGYQSWAIMIKDGVCVLNKKEVPFEYLQNELEKFDVELQVQEVLNG